MIIERQVFRDERGSFSEVFNKREFEEQISHPFEFVQDNYSRSSRGVLRGLHYQLPPAAQGKLVCVTRGKIFDVAVDIRRSSPTFGTWVGHELNEDNPGQLWVPEGFAHGFLALSEVSDVLYKTTAYYAPDLERSIRWDDPEVGIDWPLGEEAPILAPKDAAADSLSGADLFD